MQISVNFDSLDEFQRYMSCFNPKITITDQRATCEAGIAPAAEPEKAETVAVPVEDLAQKVADVVTPPEEATPEVDESYRVEVRKKLAELNKKQTGNPAKALIAETGYKRLTDVPLYLLPDLMKKAEEALDG